MGITTLYEVVANVVGGILIPIALLPDWLQTIARLLPIQAIYGVPLAILLGQGRWRRTVAGHRAPAWLDRGPLVPGDAALAGRPAPVRVGGRLMKLYGALFRISIQDALQNRLESAIWFLYEILPPLMMASVWLAAYQDQASIAGYSLAEMLAYTVGVLVLRTVVTVHMEYAIDEQIRQGELSNMLVRPMNVWGYWFVDSLGWKTFRNLLTVPVVIGCLLWLGPQMSGVADSAGSAASPGGQPGAGDAGLLPGEAVPRLHQLLDQRYRRRDYPV